MNKQEIDKWLDNEYGIYYTRLGKLNNNIIEYNIKYKEEIKKLKQAVKNTKENADEIIAEQSEEIERLKKELEKQDIDYGIEIERLNNIIKNGINEELRKELDEILKCNQKQANRIYEAIEYIKMNKYYEWHTERDEHGNIQSKKIETTLVNGSKLMDILQGSDKE